MLWPCFFWNELKRRFLFFFLKSVFFAMLGILSTPILLWSNQTALCTLSNTWLLLTTIFPLNPYLKSVERQSMCWNGSNFCSSFSTLPNKNCDICNWVKSTFRHQDAQCSILCSQNNFRMSLQKKGCFLNTLNKSWESLVTLQLPPDCWVVFWTNEPAKENTTIFCTNLPKMERSSISGNGKWQLPKKDWISLYGNVKWQWLRKTYKSNSFQF